MDFLVEIVVIALAVCVAAVWRISQQVPARALVGVARATGSLQACLAFIAFCLRP